MASIKGSYLEGCEEYASCEKIAKMAEIPGVYINIGRIFTDANEHEFKFKINVNIDLNQLSPIFSNIPFVTQDMGDLRLRIFFERLTEGMCITPVPILTTTNGSDMVASIISGIGRYPFIPGAKIVFPVSASGKTLTINSVTWTANSNGLQISQSTFNVSDYSKVAIAKYIGEDNKLAIPTQTWSTVLATAPVTSGSTEAVFQISAYNIALIAFMFPFYSNTEVIFPNPYLTSVDVTLNSKSLTYFAYDHIGYRALKDTAQAFLNNDKYAFNSVLKNSIIEGKMSSINYDKDNVTPIVATTGQQWLSTPWYYDHNFVLAFGLTPPNSFEKGYCASSSNPRSTQVRVKYQTTTVRSNFTSFAWNAQGSLNNPLNKNYAEDATVSKPPVCLALQDCLLVLDYNPVSGTCENGTIVFAEPVSV